jgi:hypothetical protein
LLNHRLAALDIGNYAVAWLARFASSCEISPRRKSEKIRNTALLVAKLWLQAHLGEADLKLDDLKTGSSKKTQSRGTFLNPPA